MQLLHRIRLHGFTVLGAECNAHYDYRQQQAASVVFVYLEMREQGKSRALTSLWFRKETQPLALSAKSVLEASHIVISKRLFP